MQRDKGWFALSHKKGARFDAPASKTSACGTYDPSADMLPTGTLLIEARRAQNPDDLQVLLHHETRGANSRRLSIYISADGRLCISVTQGACRFWHDCHMVPMPDGAPFSLTLSWDNMRCATTIFVECEKIARPYLTRVMGAVPLLQGDLKAIASDRSRHVGIDVDCFAVSDRIEPVGLSTGLLSGTRVETPDGFRPIEALRLGDLVVTATNDVMPVRWITKRQRPGMGLGQAVRLSAPFFGLARDLVCAPGHRIMMGGAEAEYLFGSQSVLIEARDLVGRRGARAVQSAGIGTWYHLMFDRHVGLNHEGIWGESLFVGASARDPETHASGPLRELSITALPNHKRLEQPVLTRPEIHSLLESAAA